MSEVYVHILTCPHCGMKKEVAGHLGENRATRAVWSDNRVVTSVVPGISFVQKCPSCGGYYLLSRQKMEAGAGVPEENIELSYDEMKEAWHLLKECHDLTENEKLAMLIMQVWAFNDKYTRNGETNIPVSEYRYMTGVIDLLLDLDLLDDMLKAELLRENGRFDEAVELIDGFSVESGLFEDFKNMFKEYALRSDTRPFLISRTGVQCC